MSKKPRADAKLLTLPKDVHRQVAERLDRESQAKVRAWLLETHQVEVSGSTLSTFYQWWHSQRFLEEVRTSADQFRLDLEALRSAGGIQIDNEAISSVAQAYFEQRALRMDDPKTFFLLRMNSQKDEALRVKREELALAKRKFQFSAAKAVLQHAEKVRPIIDGPGSEDEKTEKLGQAIFGEDWK